MATRKGKRVREVFVYFFIIFCCAFWVSGSEILKVLWGDEYSLKTLLNGQISDENSKMLIERLSKLPFTDALKAGAWSELLRYRSPDSLQLTDWKRYEPLIPYLPFSMLQGVNFSDDYILTYFGRLELKQVQLSQVAKQVKQRSGNVLEDENLIFKLGNIFCGFSPRDLFEIRASILRTLLKNNFFRSITSCSVEQLRVLSQIMIQYTLMGPPRTWQPETVRRAGSLIAGLQAYQIKDIRVKSFSEISSEVIQLSPVELLREVKNSQLKALNKSALLTWRRKTQDLRQLSDAAASPFKTIILVMTVICTCLLIS